HAFCLMIAPPPSSSVFPYTTLFRSVPALHRDQRGAAEVPAGLRGDPVRGAVRLLVRRSSRVPAWGVADVFGDPRAFGNEAQKTRSEEHTSELQSREKLVCRLLLEKK